MSDEPRLSALDEVAGGRGDVRELRRVLDDPPRQVAPARRFVLRVAGLAVQRHQLQGVLEQDVLEFSEGEFSEEDVAGGDRAGELDARVRLGCHEHNPIGEEFHLADGWYIARFFPPMIAGSDGASCSGTEFRVSGTPSTISFTNW